MCIYIYWVELRKDLILYGKFKSFWTEMKKRKERVFDNGEQFKLGLDCQKKIKT